MEIHIEKGVPICNPSKKLQELSEIINHKLHMVSSLVFMCSFQAFIAHIKPDESKFVTIGF